MNRNLRALLFDLDGTLIDTGELHYQATVSALSELGRSITRENYDLHIHGNNNTDIANFFFPEGTQKEKTEYVNLKETIFRTSLVAATPLDGLFDLLSWAENKGMAVGLVTNAPKENKDAMLEAIGLSGRFYPEILGDDLPKGKPHPLPFLTALEILGVAPEEAIGFDDSVFGIRAVSAAEMFAVGINTGQAPDELFDNGADIVIDHFGHPELLELLDGRSAK